MWRTWGIREWLMILYGLLWGSVTLILATRSSEVVEGMEWWVGLAGGELAIWKIFAPTKTEGE
jgi:hypothetical protein